MALSRVLRSACLGPFAHALCQGKWGRTAVCALFLLGLGVLVQAMYWQLRPINTSPKVVGNAPPALPDIVNPVQTSSLVALPADALFAQCAPAIVQVVIQDGDGRSISNGSGFLVNATGLIATNYHVIRDAHSAYVVFA